MKLTPKVFSERGRRRAEKLGIDPGRLPPGQSPTLKFPLFTSMGEPDVAVSDWSLAVHGAVERPFALRWDELQALEQVEVEADLHCVTRWSKFDTRWRGVRVRELLDRAGPTGAHVLAHGFDGYSTNLPLEVLRADDALIAWEVDGAPLPREHGGPARLLVPQRYLWKSAKWVRALEVTPERVLGFWERHGYHPEGDPWRSERHA